MDCTAEQLDRESLSLPSDVTMSYRESGCTSSTRSENFCNICEADFGYVTILLEVDIRLLELWNHVGCSYGLRQRMIV